MLAPVNATVDDGAAGVVATVPDVTVNVPLTVAVVPAEVVPVALTVLEPT